MIKRKCFQGQEQEHRYIKMKRQISLMKPMVMTVAFCLALSQNHCHFVKCFSTGGSIGRLFSFHNTGSCISHLSNIGHTLRMTNAEEDSDFEEIDEEHPDYPSVVLDDLSWRVEKLRLEEANTKHFLKSRPVFLPYEECKKWVAAWNRWDSEEEWREWIDMGEKRNSYIPARPDEYYGRLGQWISWSHFLGLDDK